MAKGGGVEEATALLLHRRHHPTALGSTAFLPAHDFATPESVALRGPVLVAARTALGLKMQFRDRVRSSRPCPPIDLARPHPQCRLFSGSPLRITVHSRVARSSRFIDLRSLVLLREVISDRVELGIGGGIGATYSRRTAGQENQLWPFDRLCADYALDFTDESNASLCAS